MFARWLQQTRLGRGFVYERAAADATGISEEQWKQIEAGGDPVDVLGAEGLRQWVGLLATVLELHPAEIFDLAGAQELGRQARADRARDQAR